MDRVGVDSSIAIGGNSNHLADMGISWYTGCVSRDVRYLAELLSSEEPWSDRALTADVRDLCVAVALGNLQHYNEPCDPN